MGGPRDSRILLVALALVLLLSAVAYYRSRSDGSSRAPAIAADDVWPPGRWHSRTSAAGADAEERARLLSLPYTGAGGPAHQTTGVVRHDPERTQPGVNLYTSGHAPEAILMDQDGRLLHRWRMPFERVFPDKPPTVETPFFRRAQLLGEGGLLALYQGGGLVKLDRDSRVLWSFDAGLYNDLHVAADGRVFGIAKEVRNDPRLHPTAPVLEDSIVVLDPRGRLEHRVSLLEALLDSDYAHLLEPMPPAGDVFHTNTVQLLEGGLGRLVPGFPEGAIVTSMREIDLVAVVDLDGGVHWARRGGWDAQHQPELLPSGRLLLFDNRGADGDSRILELDPASGEIVWSYAGDGERPLSSPEAGTAQSLANGNVLITESEAGRALEVTRDGEIVWEFVSPHRAGRDDRLVATLFEVLRLPSEAAAFATSRD